MKERKAWSISKTLSVSKRNGLKPAFLRFDWGIEGSRENRLQPNQPITPLLPGNPLVLVRNFANLLPERRAPFQQQKQSDI